MKRTRGKLHNINRPPRLRHLAACLAICLGVTETAHAATAFVTDCFDDLASGSLRSVIASAVSGDTVEIQANVCSKITLNQMTAIPINVADLTIKGPGRDQLTISGGFDTYPSQYHSVFAHYGAGTLKIDGLTLSYSRESGYGRSTGGCIYSSGNVSIKNSTITQCAVFSYDSVRANTKGGAVYAKGTVEVTDSIISSNFATHYSPATTGYTAFGGGIFAGAGAVISGSAISGNYVYSAYSQGGGVFVSNGPLSISTSTVSGNSAGVGGGVFVNVPSEADILYSTFSGNQALVNSAIEIGSSLHKGGLLKLGSSTVSGNTASQFQTIGNYGNTYVYNSTIAFNHAGPYDIPVGLYSNGPIVMKSSIFANNDNFDVGSEASTGTRLSGSGNLIVTTTDPVPAGTISACPRLESLADNGGPTWTQALQSNSPAINKGNDLGDPVNFDQRLLTRNVGGIDIGAYERQLSDLPDDRVFVSEFEGRCD